MRFTIERIRTLVLVAAVLLLAALGVFLAAARWKNRFHSGDVPQRLASEIQQESRNFDYTHNFGAHSRFKIHASKAIQLKSNHLELQNVEIDIFGEDGAQSEKIAGGEFDYDQKSGIALAQGPVEMLLTQPAARAGGGKPAGRTRTAAGVAGDTDSVHVKTSGVSFNRTTGLVTTAQRVDFSTSHGGGSSVGAWFDSASGHLILMQAVELTTYRGKDMVRIHAQHAEFDRNEQVCELRAATLEYSNGEAVAAQARIEFRDDGSAEQMEATGGLTLSTATGGRMTAPRAEMAFDEHNQPRHGRLEGGVIMDSTQPGRVVHGTSPTADLNFTEQGQLQRAHLERSVDFQSDETVSESTGRSIRVRRTWRSQVADLEFRASRAAGSAHLEPQTIRGFGGVTITSESRRGNAPAQPARMQADEVTGMFGESSALRSLVGTGHALMEQVTAKGEHQIARGDRLTANFRQQENRETQETRAGGKGAGSSGQGSNRDAQAGAAPDLQTAELDGHVALLEQPASAPGAQPQPPLRATAERAVYEGDGDLLHLTGHARTTGEPRIVDNGLNLIAEKVDVSRQSGDAYARGNVKATWQGANPASAGKAGAQSGSGLAGNGPAHAIADEVHLNESTGQATFSGHARLWQQASSVAAPEIVLDQHRDTFTARTGNASEPVRAVLVSAGRAQGIPGGAQDERKTSSPSVIRVRGGDLWYSDAEHRVVMRGGVAGTVVAETTTATSVSDAVELRLIPATASDDGQTQVDRMTATGHVLLTSQGRRGTGEKLVYSGLTGDYVLTGTAQVPPSMSDPDHGRVTGEALIFHSRDDSVSIEGGGSETRTETTAPKAYAP